MKDMSSDSALVVRTAVVFAFVTINAFRSKMPSRKYAERLLGIGPVGLFGISTTISWIFYYRAMKEGPVSYVASIDKASIVVTLALSFLICGNQLPEKYCWAQALFWRGCWYWSGSKPTRSIFENHTV